MVVIVPMLPLKALAPIQNHAPTPLNQVPTPGTRRTGGRGTGAHGALAQTGPFRTARATSSAKGALDRRSSAGARDEAGERLLRPEPRQHIDPRQTMTRRVGSPSERDGGPDHRYTVV